MNNANRAARAGLVFLALTTSGVVWLVFDLVTDRTVATVAGVLSLVFFTTLWAVVPAAGAAVRAPIGLTAGLRSARRAGP